MSADLNQSVATLTGARQTMSSWAKVIDSYGAVPEIYQDFFKTLRGESQPFPYVVLAPAINGYRHRTPEQLICDVNDTFYVLERVGNRVTTIGYPVKTIRDVEVGSILLCSWITLSGMTREGVATTTTLEFNTATGGRFAPFLNKIRPAAQDSSETELEAERAKFDYLTSTTFKFMNYARNSLVRGEKVIQIIWQPEIRERVATLLGWPIYRTASTAHLTILTDQELILIWEDAHSRANRGIRYGGVWRYIPLRHIVSVSLAEPANNLLTLSLTLSPTAQLDQVFTLSSKPELEQFQNEIEKLIG